jgi:uncharacterized protein with PIN domain
MNFCFAADRTLGKLAKWLRILGFDTIYESDCGAKTFYAELASQRILLTRVRQILKQYSRHRLIFIESNNPFEQVKQVIRELNLTFEDTDPFSICIRCNLALIDVDKNALTGMVPDYIWARHDSFKTCSGCRKIYWSGSHAQRSFERIEHLFDR